MAGFRFRKEMKYIHILDVHLSQLSGSISRSRFVSGVVSHFLYQGHKQENRPVRMFECSYIHQVHCIGFLK